MVVAGRAIPFGRVDGLSYRNPFSGAQAAGNGEDTVMTDRSEEFEQRTGPFRRELLAPCYRMLGSLDEAEGLVPETDLLAWRSYDTSRAAPRRVPGSTASPRTPACPRSNNA